MTDSLDDWGLNIFLSRFEVLTDVLSSLLCSAIFFVVVGLFGTATMKV
jgi:hypothetical protein